MTPTIRINPAQLKQAEKLRQLIAKHREKEDALFAELAKGMNLKREEEDVLWDYIYNDFTSFVELPQTQTKK